jgi:hypothetical protein
MLHAPGVGVLSYAVTVKGGERSKVLAAGSAQIHETPPGSRGQGGQGSIATACLRSSPQPRNGSREANTERVFLGKCKGSHRGGLDSPPTSARPPGRLRRCQRPHLRVFDLEDSSEAGSPLSPKGSGAVPPLSPTCRDFLQPRPSVHDDGDSPAVRAHRGCRVRA